MDFTKLTPEELNKMDKQVLITIIGSLQGQLNAISSQLNFLTEQIALMNQRSFGRKTESLDWMHQMTLFEVFNEPEMLCDDSREPEVGSPKNIGDPAHFSGVSPTFPEALLTFLVS